MISPEAVRKALFPVWGPVFQEDPDFYEGAADILRSYVPGRDTFQAVARRMEDYLFNALYERLGPGMTFRQADGSFRRILLSDLPSAADVALYPLFASLRHDSLNYERLHTYWMTSGSPAAMRAVYLFCQAELPEGEKVYIERIVQENVPPESRSAWLSRD